MPVGGRAAPAPGDSMDHTVPNAQEGGGGDGALPSTTCSVEAAGSGGWPLHRLQGAVSVHELKGGGFPSMSGMSHLTRWVLRAGTACSAQLQVPYVPCSSRT